MTTSRTANSSCVACDDVVTLLRTTVPASISSASLRRAAMALVSLSPKACLPARSAHSAAWMLVLPPLIMFFFPLLRKKNVLPTVPCLKNSHIPLTPWAKNRRGTFRIAERYDYRPVIKNPMPGAFVTYFSVRYTGASCCRDPQSLVCQSPITKLRNCLSIPLKTRHIYIQQASPL